MSRSSVFSNKGIFLFYWLLILPLAGYLIYTHYADRLEVLAPTLENTCSRGQKSVRVFQEKTGTVNVK